MDAPQRRSAHPLRDDFPGVRIVPSLRRLHERPPRVVAYQQPKHADVPSRDAPGSDLQRALAEVNLELQVGEAFRVVLSVAVRVDAVGFEPGRERRGVAAGPRRRRRRGGVVVRPRARRHRRRRRATSRAARINLFFRRIDDGRPAARTRPRGGGVPSRRARDRGGECPRARRGAGCHLPRREGHRRSRARERLRRRGGCSIYTGVRGYEIPAIPPRSRSIVANRFHRRSFSLTCDQEVDSTLLKPASKPSRSFRQATARDWLANRKLK
eukprot:31170-Pelagococcus_subviridis.AAC.5